jgi:hypothetical protein
MYFPEFWGVPVTALANQLAGVAAWREKRKNPWRFAALNAWLLITKERSST